MAITASDTLLHWNYFLSVEEDIVRLSRFIEFDKRNFYCFSLEIVRLLVAAAAEVDIVCKQICQQINPGSGASSINQYRDEITSVYPAIIEFEVVAPRYGLTLRPWDNWRTPGLPPDWWTAYNKIKHERHTDYYRANLHNVLNAVAGLYVACLYFYKDKAENAELVPPSAYFFPPESRYGGVQIGGYGLGIAYDLSDG